MRSDAVELGDEGVLDPVDHHLAEPDGEDHRRQPAELRRRHGDRVGVVVLRGVLARVLRRGARTRVTRGRI